MQALSASIFLCRLQKYGRNTGIFCEEDAVGLSPQVSVLQLDLRAFMRAFADEELEAIQDFSSVTS